MPSKTGPLITVTAGSLFLYGAVKGISPLKALGEIMKGSPPGKAPQDYGIGGGSLDSSVSSGAGSKVSTAPVSGAAEKANQATGKLIAASYGWATGAEWTALNAIVMQESGWNNHAQNPSSTAYGIGQFLDTTWETVGYSKTSDPVLQITAMLKYIKQRYGDPIAAEQFHLANNYY